MNTAANNSPALIIFDTVTMHKPRELERSFETLRGAKMALTAHTKRVAARVKKTNERIDAGGLGTKSESAEELLKNLIIGTYDDFNKLDYDVPTHNMLGDTSKTFMIKRSMKGGCCDPATESYHCI